MARIIKMTKDDHVVEVVESAFLKVWSKKGWEEADADAELTDLVLDVDSRGEAKADNDQAPSGLTAGGPQGVAGPVDPGTPSGQQAPSGPGLPPTGSLGRSTPAGS